MVWDDLASFENKNMMHVDHDLHHHNNMLGCPLAN